jgi:D-alanine-D-alanine ligase
MKHTPRIVVVQGGPGREAEVSRASGEAVARAARERFERVEVVELGPGAPAALLAEPDTLAFPALHGPPGEDGGFQGLCEVLGVPFVGSGVRASALAMHKPSAKLVFRAAGLPVAADVTLDPAGADPEAVIAALGEELVVKPSGEGSGLGVHFASGVEGLAEVLSKVAEEHGEVLVEERFSGREVTAAVLDRGPPLHVCEVTTPEGTWYDYEHRYTPGLSEHHIPAALPEATAARVTEVARAAFDALGCRHLARADFVVPEEGEPILLEVNTLPGMTETSLFPDIARASGVDFEDLIEGLCDEAWFDAGRDR